MSLTCCDDVMEMLMKQGQSHDERMRQTAKLAAKGGEGVDALLKKLAEDDVSPWLGLYAIVAAMVKKDGETLGRVARGSKSWVLKARGVQALAKFDQAQVRMIFLHSDTPLQLKSVIVPTLVEINEAILQTVQETPDLGGSWGALLLLQRAVTTPAHKELVRKWLPKLAKFAKMEEKPTGTFPKRHLYGQFDLENIYQSLAKKYPEVLLEMLSNETEFHYWFRCSRELAASHPDEMVKALNKLKNNSRGVWFLSRSLVRHRPQEVLQIFKEVGVLSPAFTRCFKKVMYCPRYQDVGLDVIRHCAPNTESWGDIQGVVQLLVKLLKKGSTSQKIQDTVADVLAVHTETKCRHRCLGPIGELDKLMKTAEEEKWTLRPSQERVNALVAAQINSGDLCIDLCKDGALNVALGHYVAQTENRKATHLLVTAHTEYRDMLPREVVSHVLSEWVASDEFSELDVFVKISAHADMEISKSEEPLKALANTRDPRERTAVLSALIHSSKVSPVKTNRFAAIMGWIAMRITKEETSVKAPVVQCLLEETPIVNFKAETVKQLEKFFNICLKWGNGIWMNAWSYWAASAVIHYKVLSDETSVIVELGEQILARMQEAGVQTAKTILRAFSQAADKIDKKKLDDKTQAAVGVQMLSYAKEAFSNLSELSNEEAQAYTKYEPSEVFGIANFDKFKELFTIVGPSIVLGSPELEEHAKTLIVADGLSLSLSGMYLMDTPCSKIVKWPFWRDTCVSALSHLRHSQTATTVQVFQAVSDYILSLEKHLSMDAAAKDSNAVQKYLQFYKPLLVEACHAYAAGIQEGKSWDGAVCFSADHSFRVLVAILKYIPELDVGIKAIIKAISLMRDAVPTATQSLLRHIGNPEEHTADIFAYAVEHINPMNAPASVFSLVSFCDAKHVVRDPAVSSKHHKPPVYAPDGRTFSRRPRFRFQRGAAAARRKASTAMKKKDERQRVKDSPDWGLPLVQLIEELPVECSFMVYEKLDSLLRTPVSKTKLAIVKALFTVLRKSDPNNFRFSTIWDHPELEAFMAETVNVNNVEEAVRSYLGPFHKRKQRMQTLMTKGMGSCTPGMVFEHSPSFQKGVFRYYPDSVVILMGARFMALPGIVDGLCTRASFGGQTTSVQWYVQTLPPWVQQFLWDECITPFAFDVSTGELFRECSSYEHTEGREDGHQMKARRLWLGAALPSAPEIPPVTSADHPFNKFFAKTISDGKAVSTLVKEEQDSVTKSDKLSEDTLKASRSAQLCLELLLALRTHDNSCEALDVLTKHLDQGVANKAAIPSTAAVLRCLSPTEACEVLHKILGSKNTRASARSQLGRCCIKLLKPEQALDFVEQEWKHQGSWVMVDADDEEKEETVFASTKVALLCSLVASPSLRMLPSLWGRVTSITERTDENIYIAGQMLQVLAGVNDVAALNTQHWPLCAADGLARLVASFFDVQTLQDYVKVALRRWFAMLKCNPSMAAPCDAEGVIHALMDCMDASLVCDMISTLTSAHPGLFARICKRRVDQISAAVADNDMAKLNENSCALVALTKNGKTMVGIEEYEKAIDVLVAAPGGATAALQLVASHWQGRKDCCEGAALLKIAEFLSAAGQPGYTAFTTVDIFKGMISTQALPELCKSMLTQIDDGPAPSDSYKYVMLKYIKYHSRGADKDIAELVKRLFFDPSQIVAAAAIEVLDSQNRFLARGRRVRTRRESNTEPVWREGGRFTNGGGVFSGPNYMSRMHYCPPYRQPPSLYGKGLGKGEGVKGRSKGMGKGSKRSRDVSGTRGSEDVQRIAQPISKGKGAKGVPPPPLGLPQGHPSAMLPPGMPPNMLPPGMLPPGMLPPGMPPGMLPPGMPPNMLPPGMLPPGMPPPPGMPGAGMLPPQSGKSIGKGPPRAC